MVSDGYFCAKKLKNREIVLSKVPLNAVSDAFIQSNGGAISFKIKNSRNVKNVRFSFLTSSFAIPEVDAINNTTETKWILTLKMTPIIDY